MQIIWDKQATEELNDLVAFIAIQNPQNAVMILDGLLALSETLSQMPFKYPKEPYFNREDIRYVLKFNHKLIYQVEENRITVLRVFSAKRNITL